MLGKGTSAVTESKYDLLLYINPIHPSNTMRAELWYECVERIEVHRWTKLH
jgi:hypothetical protein